MNLTESKIGAYSYSCLMASIRPEDAFSVIRSITATVAPSDLVWGDGNGVELDPHVTVLYGIHERSAKPFVSMCSEIEPFHIAATRLSIFEGGEYDVLKLDSESPTLVEMNEIIRTKFEHTSSFPDYHPHLTIGYLKKGAASKYVGDGDTRGITTLCVNGFVFSSSSSIRGKVSIPCKDPNASLASKLLSAIR